VVLTDVEREIETLAARNGSGRVQQPAEGLREIARRGAREAERRALEDVLHRVGWNRAAASRILKVSYKTLLNKIVDCGLTPSCSRQSADPRAGRPGR
jgi:DNA-binding NtrC family response regulator